MFIFDALLGFVINWVVVGAGRLILPVISLGRMRVTPLGESTEAYPESGVMLQPSGVYYVSPKTVSDTMLGLLVIAIGIVIVVALARWGLSAIR